MKGTDGKEGKGESDEGEGQGTEKIVQGKSEGLMDSMMRK